jgi:glyoxylase-like metal-dependent hydrolase (beta-lactamase superfamily II)
MDTAGIARAEIDLVILTHTDGDHTGGLIDAEGSLAFPNAQCAMTRPAWNLWTSEHYLRRLPDDRAASVEKLTALINERMRLLDAGAEIVPGVRFVPAPGHRQGHVAVEISSEREKLLHVADAILHPLFIMHPSWHSPIDSEPAEAAETRQLLLSRIADNNMLVASAHLPFPGLGHVEAQGEKWLWRPIA